MGDVRLTRWLSETAGIELSDKQLWIELITFLEKDLKVQQQKLLQNIFDFSNAKSGSKGDSKSEKYSSRFTTKADHENCKFCGKRIIS